MGEVSTAPGARVESLSFSPDGRTLASRSEAGAYRFWDPASGRPGPEIERTEAKTGSAVSSPDGRLRAVASAAERGGTPRVELEEAVSGRVVCAFEGHRGSVSALAFSPDGRLLASGDLRGEIIVWAVPSPGAGEEDPDARWAELGERASDRASAAVRWLSQHPAVSLPFLRLRLKPPAADDARLRALVGQLDDDDFGVREEASRQLGEIGEPAAPVLREALGADAGASPELRARAAALLREIEESSSGPAPEGEPLRRVRAIQILGLVGTEEARAILEEIRKTSPSARERREAETALGRARTRR